MRKDNERCKDCLYYEKIGQQTGECVRYPPNIVLHFLQQPVFPEVHAKQWCGEWKAKRPDN